MPTRYHRAGSTDWSQAASWHDGTGGSSAVPADTDVIIIGEGSAHITSGLAQGAVDAANIDITSGFAGSIGTSGTSLVIACNAAVGQGTGLFRYGASGGRLHLAAGTNGIDMFVLSGACAAHLTGGVFGVNDTSKPAVTVASGECTIGDAVDLSAEAIVCTGGRLIVEYRADATAPILHVAGNADVVCRRPMTTIHIGGGRITLIVEKSLTAATTVNLWGGMLDFRGGNITTLNAYGGTYTAGNLARPATITTTNVWATRVLALHGPGSRVTYTTINKYGPAQDWPG